MSASDYEVLDPRFRGCFNRTASVDRLWTGGRWTEGPAYFPAGRHLVFSDIPNNRMMRFDECDGSVSVFRQPANYANGNTVDRQGRLVTCEHGGRRVVRTEHDGRLTLIADQYQGKRLNSPNDVVVRSDGSIWFTDPPYGILSDYEGHKADSEVGGNYVYRVDGATGEVRVVADDFIRPNGLAFSADERRLYIVDSPAGGPTTRSTSGCSMSAPMARSAEARYSPTAPRAASTAYASTMPAGCGRRPTRGSTASMGTGR